MNEKNIQKLYNSLTDEQKQIGDIDQFKDFLSTEEGRDNIYSLFESIGTIEQFNDFIGYDQDINVQDVLSLGERLAIPANKKETTRLSTDNTDLNTSSGFPQHIQDSKLTSIITMSSLPILLILISFVSFIGYKSFKKIFSFKEFGKDLVFIIAGLLIAMIGFSIAAVLNALINSDPSGIPGPYLYFFSNGTAVIFISILYLRTKRSLITYYLTIFIYGMLTWWGMSGLSYPWYYYLILSLMIIGPIITGPTITSKAKFGE